MTTIIEVHNTTRKDPVGRCIYCGSTKNLSDEHIVPLGLSGNLVLPQASCAACAEITSLFERKVLRGFMLEARAVGKFRTGHPQNRPKTTRLKVGERESDPWVELDIANSPGFLHLPKLAPPSFLSIPPSHTSGTNIVGIEIIYFGKHPHEVAAALNTKTITSTVNIDVPSFARMLAKIGYSYAVSAIGSYPLNEVPVLPAILGTSDDASSWVGSADFRLPVEDKHPTHALGLKLLSRTTPDATEEITVAQVKLFASSGATGYEVVVRRR